MAQLPYMAEIEGGVMAGVVADGGGVAGGVAGGGGVAESSRVVEHPLVEHPCLVRGDKLTLHLDRAAGGRGVYHRDQHLYLAGAQLERDADQRWGDARASGGAFDPSLARKNWGGFRRPGEQIC